MKREHSHKKIRKKYIVILFASLFVIVLAGVLTPLIYAGSMLNKIQYATHKSNKQYTAQPNLSSEVSSETSAADLAIEENLKNNSTPLAYDKDVFNILLVGCDARDTSEPSRSDSMILLSINNKSKKIVMTSIMRDIYLAIPGYEDDRINAAYSYGGADLLLQTIQQNFKIKVDKYISVNFDTFIDIIDKLGGVNIDVTDAEVPYVNECVEEINQIKGLDADDGKLTVSGSNIHLTGKQAMGYARIRYIGNDDFDRTQRQRIILTQICNKLKGQNIVQINNIFNILLPDVTTNLSKGEMFSLLLSSPTFLNYPVTQDRIPVDDSFEEAFIREMDVMTIDFDKNIDELQNAIYGASH